ncbi:MAG: uncharacterized protein QOF40_1969 [Actinomycetota bacterium]|nr:uncharacterized protein [Actinomycetota bacterium]
MALPLVVLLGIAIGVVYGLFGAGGSAFATPILALMGVPAPVAVASPLPAVLPASLLSAREYFRAGMLDRRVAKLAVLAGVPTVLVGAFASRVVSGQWLLILSGLLLLGVGTRMLVPARSGGPGRAAARAAARVDSTTLVVALVAMAGFVAGLLAAGGGILLVPIFVMALGFTTARAAGTSLVVAAALTVPTVTAHWLLGNIDWSIAAAFALGMVPTSFLAAQYGPRLPDRITRPAFGVVLLVFSLFFVACQLG